MWSYDRKLQYPVKIARPDARAAKIIITQYGGPDGELGASMRYLSQRYSMPYKRVAGLLTDIGTEELAPKCYTLFWETFHSTPCGGDIRSIAQSAKNVDRLFRQTRINDKIKGVIGLLAAAGAGVARIHCFVQDFF